MNREALSNVFCLLLFSVLVSFLIVDRRYRQQMAQEAKAREVAAKVHERVVAEAKE